MSDEYQFDYRQAKPNRFALALKKGGQLVATGTPEQIVRNRRSHTARALEKVLKNGKAG